MQDGLTVTEKFHFVRAKRSKLEIKPGPQPIRDTTEGRIPRVARLMALAIKFDHLLRTGAVRDQAELAELGHVTRARVTQIMNLLHLAPDIQEAILNLPRTTHGHDPLSERHLRPITAQPDWRKQRTIWAGITVRLR
jgi:predicted XRE-type DNA-binding protein